VALYFRVHVLSHRAKGKQTHQFNVVPEKKDEIKPKALSKLNFFGFT
jgi:hypothetical protein